MYDELESLCDLISRFLGSGLNGFVEDEIFIIVIRIFNNVLVIF